MEGRSPSSGFLQKSFVAGNVIFREGEQGDKAYVLISGLVEISGTVQGRKKVFALLKPVTIFGEMALFLGDQARTATAVALEDSQCVVFTRSDLSEYTASAPPVVSTMLSVLVQRLKVTTKKAVSAPNPASAAARILALLAQCGVRETALEPVLRSIAETLSLSVETVEGYVTAMAGKGLLDIRPDRTGTFRNLVLKGGDEDTGPPAE